MRRRMVKPEIFTDAELAMTIGAEGVLFYIGLWSAAEDSGCFVPDPFELKGKIFPFTSTVEDVESYLQMLVDMNKVILYIRNGKKYAYLKNFHVHQNLEKPPMPVLPIPDWITWVMSENRRQRGYSVDENALYAYISGAHPKDVRDTSGTRPGHVRQKGIEKKGIEKKRIKDPVVRSSTDQSNLERSPEVSGTRPVHGQDTSGTNTQTKEQPQLQRDEAFGEVVRMYTENGFGELTELMAEKLTALIDDFGTEMVKSAIDEAVEQNVRRFSYIKKICQGRKARGEKGELVYATSGQVPAGGRGGKNRSQQNTSREPEGGDF